MALKTHRKMLLFVVSACLNYLQRVSAEGNTDLPDISSTGNAGVSFFSYQKSEHPRDCSEVRDSCLSSEPSGVYLIQPEGYEEPFEAFCWNDIDSEGWTVILRRFDGLVDFTRKWNDYKKGFGFLSTEFWLGNEKISYLTNQVPNKLRIDITFDNGTTCDVQYRAFRISDEWSGFKLSTLGTYKSEVVCRWVGRECNTLEDCHPPIVVTSFTDCNDVFSAGNTQDGVYYIHPAGWNGPPFKVFCNMSIDGGSWTVFQRRLDGSTDFFRNWTEYKNGFGVLQHEFWLGNEKLHFLTEQATYEYRVDYVLPSLDSYYNKYSNFHVDNEASKYRLTNVGTRTGNRGYSFYNINNTPFSTYDEDNDGRNYNCAEGHRSGWWHGAWFYSFSHSYCTFFQSGSTFVRCSDANLNGDYKGGTGGNIFDNHNSHAYDCNLRYTEMKIRRVS